MATLTDAQGKELIKAELKRRFDLINNKEFVNICIDTVKRLGMTAKEWNKNKAPLLMMFANEAIGIENKIIREKEENK